MDIADRWTEAAESVLEYNPVRGDAVASATAVDLDATFLVGGDHDYDGIGSVSLVHVRHDSA